MSVSQLHTLVNFKTSDVHLRRAAFGNTEVETFVSCADRKFLFYVFSHFSL